MLFGSGWNKGLKRRDDTQGGAGKRKRVIDWKPRLWVETAAVEPGITGSECYWEVGLSDALGSWRARAIAEAITYRLLRYQMCSYESRKKKKKSPEIHKTHWGNALKIGQYQSPQNKEPKWKPLGFHVLPSQLPPDSKDIFSPLLSDLPDSYMCVPGTVCCDLTVPIPCRPHENCDPNLLTFGFLCLS